MNKSALLIVDVQNDFCPGGALPVKDGDKVVPVINRISDRFPVVIATQDWHPSGHVSFASRHDRKIGDSIEVNGILQFLWPDHCVQGSFGASFHPELLLDPVDLILRKGSSSDLDSYSAFFENDRKRSTGLEGYLKRLDVDTVYLAGLATDYCVYFSALDAHSLGFDTVMILDATRGVDMPQDNIRRAVDDMMRRGIRITEHQSLSL